MLGEWCVEFLGTVVCAEIFPASLVLSGTLGGCSAESFSARVIMRREFDARPSILDPQSSILDHRSWARVSMRNEQLRPRVCACVVCEQEPATPLSY
eukprot:2088672-Rhodomonas_salina.1